jgi:acetoin utilization deacetylase AcuC-like enzyme
MKVVWSEEFLRVYSEEPAAAAGRMEAIVQELEGWAQWVAPVPATDEELLRCHTPEHLKWVQGEGVEKMARLAAGGAVLAAHLGREEPAFALIRPPGHHASRDHAWGFCYFNNLAVALVDLRSQGRVKSALVLDFGLHVGDGTEHILGREDWVTVLNPKSPARDGYLLAISEALEDFEGDTIAVSAGFDNHAADWGGLLTTEDYRLMGLDVGNRARILRAGCFAVLEGGYNHGILGENVRAFCHGLEQGWTKGASGHLDEAREQEGKGAVW